MRQRWTTLSGALAVFLSFVGVGIAPAPADAAPNVVVILADDMGFSDLGCYGGEIQTPNVDRLAADGLRFTQFYNTARCWPTRAALLTGYYAQQVRRDVGPGIDRGNRPAWAPLLPKLLAPHGYRSYISGKWHIDGDPLQSGFNRAFIRNNHDNHFATGAGRSKRQAANGPATDAAGYSTTAITDQSLGFLRGHARDHAEQPFFLYVAYISPHFPLHAPAEDIARYDGKYDAGWEGIRAERWRRVQELGVAGGTLSAVERDLGPPHDNPNALKVLGEGEVNRPLPWDELTDSQRRFQADKMEIHAAMVDRIDREVGRLVAELKTMNVFQDTLILVLSDNGASAEILVRGGGHDPEAARGSSKSYLCLGPGWSTVANTPFRRHKTWVHEGGICTPLIAHWPKGIEKPGRLVVTPGHVIDLVPTVLGLIGEGDDKPLTDDAPPRPGANFAHAFSVDADAADRELWWLHEGHRAFRRGDWKIVSARGEPWELFDLAKDRTETNNLAALRPELVKSLAKRWEQQLEQFQKDLKN